MKKLLSKKTKIVLASSIVLSIICYISACITLYNSNFSFANYYNSNNWHSDWLFDDDSWHFNAGRNHSQGTLNKALPSTVENINIDTSSTDINVSFYEGSDIKIDIDGYFASNYTYNNALKTFDINDKTATISTDNSINWSSLNICIYVPNTYKNNLTLNGTSSEFDVKGNGQLNNLSLKTSSGDIDISNLTTNNTFLQTTSGSIKLENLTASNSTLGSTSGDIYLDMVNLGSTKIATTSGGITLNANNLGNTTNIASTSGSVSLNVSRTTGYTVSFTSISGDLHSPNGNHGNYTNGDGSKVISVATTSGDLNIN